MLTSPRPRTRSQGTVKSLTDWNTDVSQEAPGIQPRGQASGGWKTQLQDVVASENFLGQESVGPSTRGHKKWQCPPLGPPV